MNRLDRNPFAAAQRVTEAAVSWWRRARRTATPAARDHRAPVPRATDEGREQHPLARLPHALPGQRSAATPPRLSYVPRSRTPSW
ncbi:hypothetical protein ABZ858_13900 [Streptomyces sp. NPDC047017]|uniref:hypothetical protein n=1 Tax=Streptomyces sp. NPDC047017 TaxID=3155024 RepID=UPI0033C6E3F9